MSLPPAILAILPFRAVSLILGCQYSLNFRVRTECGLGVFFIWSLSFLIASHLDAYYTISDAGIAKEKSTLKLGKLPQFVIQSTDKAAVIEGKCLSVERKCRLISVDLRIEQGKRGRERKRKKRHFLCFTHHSFMWRILLSTDAPVQSCSRLTLSAVSLLGKDTIFFWSLIAQHVKHYFRDPVALKAQPAAVQGNRTPQAHVIASGPNLKTYKTTKQAWRKTFVVMYYAVCSLL